MDGEKTARFSEARQALRKQRDRLRRLDGLLKGLEGYSSDPEGNAFVLRDRLPKLLEALDDLEAHRGVADMVKALSDDLSSQVDDAFQRAKSAVATGIARRVAERGLELTGNLPRLSCGPLTLEFSLVGEGRVNISFGPRIERLKQVPIHTDLVVDAVFSIYEELDGDGFDEVAHLDLLQRAYVNAVRISAGGDGTAVPISGVLLQTAFLKQGKKFLADPLRGNYRSYGRVQFAYDLSRTQRHSTEDRELFLTVASMEQTRRSADHLWIPRGPRDPRGTHYSMLAFRRMAR
jgi:hypothetical protein